MIYAHSDVSIHLHIVWSTRRRRELLDERCDEWLHDFMRDKLRALSSAPIAVGNASDHVHVLATLPPTISVADFVKALKGASSHAWNLRARLRPLYWQAGYLARSVDASAIVRLKPYIERQRHHHARNGDLVETIWEQDWSPEFASCRAREGET